MHWNAWILKETANFQKSKYYERTKLLWKISFHRKLFHNTKKHFIEYKAKYSAAKHLCKSQGIGDRRSYDWESRFFEDFRWSWSDWDHLIKWSWFDWNFFSNFGFQSRSFTREKCTAIKILALFELRTNIFDIV